VNLYFVRTRTQTIDCDCRPPRPHGVYHTYNVHKCGCDACRKAANVDVAARKSSPRTTSAEPVRERVLLLRELGVNTKRLAEELGYHPNTLYHVIRRVTARVSVELSEDVFSYPLPTRKDLAS